MEDCGSSADRVPPIAIAKTPMTVMMRLPPTVLVSLSGSKIVKRNHKIEMIKSAIDSINESSLDPRLEITMYAKREKMPADRPTAIGEKATVNVAHI